MLIPRLLLPTSRLWLPGMRINPLGRFGVCANCCQDVPQHECAGCPSGTAAAEYAVTFSGFSNAGACTNCELLNDTFILTWESEVGTTCNWTHCESFAICSRRTNVYIGLSLFASTVVQLYVIASDTNCASGGLGPNFVVYQGNYADSCTFTDLVLNRLSTNGDCNTPATCTVSAVVA